MDLVPAPRVLGGPVKTGAGHALSQPRDANEQPPVKTAVLLEVAQCQIPLQRRVVSTFSTWSMGRPSVLVLLADGSTLIAWVNCRRRTLPGRRLGKPRLRGEILLRRLQHRAEDQADHHNRVRRDPRSRARSLLVRRVVPRNPRKANRRRRRGNDGFLPSIFDLDAADRPTLLGSMHALRIQSVSLSARTCPHDRLSHVPGLDSLDA